MAELYTCLNMIINHLVATRVMSEPVIVEANTNYTALSH